MLSQFSSNESIITSELRLVANDVLVSSVVKLWIVLSDDMLTPVHSFVNGFIGQIVAPRCGEFCGVVMMGEGGVVVLSNTMIAYAAAHNNPDE